MNRKRLRIPSLTLHKATGQSRVRIKGKSFYLGRYGSVQAQEKYEKLIAEYLASGRVPGSVEDTGCVLTIQALKSRYLRFAEAYYRKNGKSTSEISCIENAISFLEFYEHTPAQEFGPQRLKAVREKMIAKGVSRSTINARVSRIRRMFKWGVSEELIPPAVLQALESLPGLRRGRTEAKETSEVSPVDECNVNKILKHVSPQVRDMIRLQLLAGCRPGEIVSIRPADIDREGEIWEYVPTDHKMKHLGRDRRVFFGPKAQAILLPYLDRSEAAPCFSPIEAEQHRRHLQRHNRKTPVQPSQVDRKSESPKWQPSDRYTSASYRKAIHRACDLVSIDRWSPNQLRHTRATYLRRQYGIEAAQTILGHSNLSTSEIYAERDFQKARQVMLEVG